MSDIKRAKNFEGLLHIIAEATGSLRENLRLLGRSQDNDSVMSARRTHEALSSMEFLGRDLAAGLVDLEATPFDQRAHKLAFQDADLLLEGDPERRLNSGRRAEDRLKPIREAEVPELVLSHPIPEERAAFDFEGEDLKSEAQHRVECDENVPQPEPPAFDIMNDEIPASDGPFEDPDPTVPIIPQPGETA